MSAAVGRLRSRMAVKVGDQSFDPSTNIGRIGAYIKYYAPTGAAGDAASLIALCATMAGVGEVRVRPGTVLVDSVMDFSALSNLILIAHPNTVFKASLTPTGGPGGFAQSAFYMNAATVGSDTTLAALTVVDAYTISATAIPGGYNASTILGKTIVFGRGADNTYQQAIVRACSGAGPYTLTLDEPVQYAITSGAGSVVGVRTVPSNIKFYFNGAKITGSSLAGGASSGGDRAIEIGFGRGIVVDDVQIVRDTGVFEAGGISFDTGSIDCIGRKLRVDGGQGDATKPSRFGLGLESCIRCYIEDFVVHHCDTQAGDAGVFMPSARFSELRGGQVYKVGIGVTCLSGGGADSASSRRCKFTGLSIVGAATDGIAIQDGAVDFEIANTHVAASGRYGLYAYLATGSPDRVKLTNVTIETSATSGIRLANASRIDGALVVLINNATGIDMVGTSVAKIDRLRIHGGAIAISAVGAVQLDAPGASITDPTTSALYARTGAAVKLEGHQYENNNVLATNAIIYDVDDTATWITIGGHAKVSATGKTVHGFLVTNTGARIDCEGLVIERTAGTAGVCFYGITAGIFSYARTRTIGAWQYGCYAVDAATKHWVEGDCDFSSCTSPFAGGGAQSPHGGGPNYNFGTVTLNGTTQVDTGPANFPIGATISLSLKTVGSTPGTAAPYHSAANTAGHHFLKSPTASCNDVYNWRALLKADY